MEAGTRVICASSGTTKDPGQLATLKRAGVGDGHEPQPSWFDQAKDMRDPKSFFDWSKPDAAKSTAYVQSLIRDQIKRGVAAERVFVLGHSAGACVGSRAALTFPDATLGGLIMLSAWHASQDLEEVTSEAQRKKLKVFAAHSPDDRAAVYNVVVEMYELVKAVVGKHNFIFVKEDDNFPPSNHLPFVPSVKKGIADMLQKK